MSEEPEIINRAKNLAKRINESTVKHIVEDIGIQEKSLVQNYSAEEAKHFRINGKYGKKYSGQ